MQTSNLQHYIYKISCKETGEYYYGKRTAVDWKADPYMGSGYLLKKKMEAHPDYTWTKEVLLLLDSAEEAYEYEAIVIGDKWKDDPKCLNLCPGGEGGMGLNHYDLAKREALKKTFEVGETIEVATFYMSNDTSKQCIQLHKSNDQTRVVETLLAEGWYFGGTTCYKKTTLKELALTRNDYYKSCFLRGEVPEGIAGFNFSNHELKQRISVPNNYRTLEVATTLLKQGWVCGMVESYERVTYGDLNIKVADFREESFLSGGFCDVINFIMYNDKLGICVLLTANRKIKDRPFPRHTKTFYDAGWKFLSQERGHKRVTAKEALKTIGF